MNRKGSANYKRLTKNLAPKTTKMLSFAGLIFKLSAAWDTGMDFGKTAVMLDKIYEVRYRLEDDIDIIEKKNQRNRGIDTFCY